VDGLERQSGGETPGRLISFIDDARFNLTLLARAHGRTSAVYRCLAAHYREVAEHRDCRPLLEQAIRVPRRRLLGKRYSGVLISWHKCERVFIDSTESYDYDSVAAGSSRMTGETRRG